MQQLVRFILKINKFSCCFFKATTPAEFANRSDKIVVPRLPLWVPLVGAMAGLILLVFIVIVCCLVCLTLNDNFLSIKTKRKHTHTHIIHLLLSRPVFSNVFDHYLLLFYEFFPNF